MSHGVLQPGSKDVTLLVDGLESDVTAIKAKTDNLPSDPADASVVAGNITTAHIATNSAIGTVDAFHDVPSQNTGDNVVMSDVIGNKTDDEDGDSIYSRLYKLEKHIHSVSWVYPELANGIQLQKGSGAWAAYPTPTEIMPASTKSDPFDIHHIQVNNISANGEYTIAIYQGAALSEVLLGTIPVSRSAAQSQEGSAPGITIIVPGITRISAALSSGNVAQNTIVMKICGHGY